VKPKQHKPKANTIEEIEQAFWGDPPLDATHLVETCHKLRRKDLSTFVVEDYRILIGQNIVLQLLIPPAMEILQKNICAEGVLYEGDLLSSVLTSEKAFWKEHPVIKAELINLVERNINFLEAKGILDRKMKRAFDTFRE
jgi:hypothetical protein